MILPSFRLADYANWQGEYSGIDSPNHYRYNRWATTDRTRINHFEKYPYTVEYNYNSRGFRDREWPDDISKDIIWCFGDSFTAGLGCPVEHTWPRQLEKLSNRTTITVAMDGASNEWMARKIHECQQEINPRTIVVQWSYIHRREGDFSHADAVRSADGAWSNFYSKIKKSHWPESNTWISVSSLPKDIKQEIIDCYLDDQLHFVEKDGDIAINWEVCDNWRRLLFDESQTHYMHDRMHFLRILESFQKYTNVIHGFIPKFCSADQRELIIDDLKSHSIQYIPEVKILDYGRDYHHYDIRTAAEFAKKALDKLD
jgi:hypothetical protein